jgi:hypothetical protein
MIYGGVVHPRAKSPRYESMAVSSASVLTRDFEKLPTVGDYTHPNRIRNNAAS